jgi:hypothetical protein
LAASRYLAFVKNTKVFKEGVPFVLNESEAKLRNHDEFEDVFDDDLEAISDFRNAGDFGSFVVEDPETATQTTYAESTKAGSIRGRSTQGGSLSQPRMSMGSSVSSIRSKASHDSLESIAEGDEDKNNDSGDEEEAKLDDGHLTPSPNKRRKMTPSQTDFSVSTLGQPRGSGIGSLTGPGDDSSVSSA